MSRSGIDQERKRSIAGGFGWDRSYYKSLQSRVAACATRDVPAFCVDRNWVCRRQLDDCGAEVESRHDGDHE